MLSISRLAHVRLGWALNAMTIVLRREGRARHIRGESHVKVKAEVGVMHLQAKELQWFLEAARN